jgi:hypothetical protein
MFRSGFATGEEDGKHETPLQKSLFDPEFDLVVPAKSSSEVSDFSDLFSGGPGGSAAGGGGGGGFTSLLDTSSFLNKAS